MIHRIILSLTISIVATPWILSRSVEHEAMHKLAVEYQATLKKVKEHARDAKNAITQVTADMTNLTAEKDRLKARSTAVAQNWQQCKSEVAATKKKLGDSMQKAKAAAAEDVDKAASIDEKTAANSVSADITASIKDATDTLATLDQSILNGEAAVLKLSE